MKVSKLIEKLGREIDEKAQTRDQLLAKVMKAAEELRDLDEQRAVVTALVERYTSQDSGAIAEPVEEQSVATVSKNVAQDGLAVHWPVGPHYKKQFKAKSRQAWALYKLGTADWYLKTLEEIAEHIDKLDRFLGIEMAIDGTLQALCATFDAAVFALLSTLEKGAGLPEDERTPARLASWTVLLTQAEALGVELIATSEVSAALAAEDPDAPSGWLSQLLLLRQRSLQHDLLIRHWPLGLGAPGVGIDLPGSDPQPPLEYLRSVRDRMEGLLKIMLDDQELLRLESTFREKHPKATTSGELPSLLRRAGVIQQD
jgi:hypothetical protein